MFCILLSFSIKETVNSLDSTASQTPSDSHGTCEFTQVFEASCNESWGTCDFTNIFLKKPFGGNIHVNIFYLETMGCFHAIRDIGLESEGWV